MNRKKNYYSRIQSNFESIMDDWNPQCKDGVCLLPVFKGIVGREEVKCATQVDEDVYVQWSKVMWIQNATGYILMNWSHRNCERVGKKRDEVTKLHTFLHRVVLEDVPEGYTGDHINGDVLNNTRANLRPASYVQNGINSIPSKRGSCKYKGVSVRVFGGKKKTSTPKVRYKVQMYVKGEYSFFGYYDHPLEAAKVYDREAFKEYGEYARLNKDLYPEDFD